MSHDFYEMYLEEMGAIDPLSPKEEEALLERTAQGDEQARKRLVEGSLRKAADLARSFEGGSLPPSDLVQEANMALMLAAVEYDGQEDWQSLLERRVKEGLKLALADQDRELEIEETMAARVNVLQTVSQAMAKELGREATVEELAEKMKMTQEEIKDIMKLALDALTIDGQGQAAGDQET